MAKKKPTKAERDYMSRVAELGCMICGRPAEIHHIRTGKGTTRASNYEVIPLCPDHHRNGGPGVAIHAGIETWRENFGCELEMLKRVKELVA